MFRYVVRRHKCLFLKNRSISTSVPHPITRLKELDFPSFRHAYFKPGIPVSFSHGTFAGLTAATRWFTFDKANSRPALDSEYLERFATTTVPVELYVPAQGGEPATFQRSSATLGMCMKMMHATQDQTGPRVYIAQCPLVDLPDELQADLPTPDLVNHAGKGDIYDSSIWLGHAPTYTPLHKDPNPNLFVQLCGTKAVRLLKPPQGEMMMQHVRRSMLRADTSSAIRGDEMMAGAERDLLEKLIWDDPGETLDLFECTLAAGEGLFIPKGWWHSVKGVGQGMNGSVNWWFR